MIKQSFLFNELLARKELENANTCKQKSFLTNKSKEEYLFQCTQNETTSYFAQKIPFSFKCSNATKTNLFQKRFLYFIKHLKL